MVVLAQLGIFIPTASTFFLLYIFSPAYIPMWLLMVF
jgi:hypothetical protein